MQYIDGFAGPGRYSGGEEGSPIIALRAALEHKESIATIVQFLFVERDQERANCLSEMIADIECPSNFCVKVEAGVTFESAFDRLLVSHGNVSTPFPPTFAFIDPFGWSGVPFDIVTAILGHRSCEVLVTFMYEEINRFIGHPDQVTNFERFFGTNDWRLGTNLKEPHERNRFLHDLYLRQIHEKAGAKYVRSFQMKNNADVTDYYLFYATNNLLGLKKMKEAMWKVDESGEFTFSDATDKDQFVLFGKEPRIETLKKQISARFRGKTSTVAQVEEFVLAETAFRETHYKRQVLKTMEKSNPPEIEVVNPPPDRRIGTFPDQTMQLRFI